MDTRKKNVSQVATMAFRMSHKYAHMHTHLAAKGYHRTKRAVKATDHSFAAQSWHCHFLLAVPTAAERETERERERFIPAFCKGRCQMFSQPHILCSQHFFASTLHGPRVQWSLIHRDLQALIVYVWNFKIPIVGIFLLPNHKEVSLCYVRLQAYSGHTAVENWERSALPNRRYTGYQNRHARQRWHS